jgi:Ca2+-binding EF-hand superfamily protein
MARRLDNRQNTVVRGASRSAKGRDDVIDPKKLPDFTSKELEELREAFDIFDKQNRGVCDIG